MSKTARTFVLLFLLAFAVRLGVGLWVGMSREPVEDEKGYVKIGQSLADGRGFKLFHDGEVHYINPTGSEVEPKPDDLVGWNIPGTPMERDIMFSFRGPVAPLLYAPVADAGIQWMRLVSLCLGALGPPLLFLALRNSSLGDRAWWPAAAYALWPPAIYVSVRALSEAPSQALLLGAVAALVAPRTRGGIAGGALAALAVLARPAALIPAALLVFATGTRRRAIGFVIAFMAVLAPWEIRNWNLHGRLLLTTSSGAVLVGGNSQAAADAAHPGKWVTAERVYEGAADPPDLGVWGWSALTEEASDRRFTADALRWVGEHPGAAARLEFWKFVRLFDPDPRSEKDDATSKAIVGWLTLSPVLLLAILGARRGDRVWWLLLAGTVLTALVFYGDTRMRTCADPTLLVFAARGVTLVAGRWRSRAVH